MGRAVLRDGDALSRRAAARLLWEARRASRTSDAAETLDWALQLAPDSRPAIRMRVRLFLIEDDLESARSMIGRSLLAHADDALLRVLHAECLLRSGKLREANRAIRSALDARPERCDALELAAQIAIQSGEHARAIGLLEICRAKRPDDERIAMLLTEALVRSGEAENIEQAEELMTCIASPAPMLMANVLIARGRSRDALEYLEARVDAMLRKKSSGRRSAANDNDDALLAQYITVLESCGETARLKALPARVDTLRHVQAATALGRAMLAQGRFRGAIALTLPLARLTADNAEALGIVMVAATMFGRDKLARLALRRLRGCARISQNAALLASLADCWRRGLLGSALREKRTPGATVHRAHTSVLRPLAQRVGVPHLVGEAARCAEIKVPHLVGEAAMCAATT